MFLDKDIINNAVGPGEPSEFEKGAWQNLCHLAASCAVMERPSGDLMWIEISYVPVIDHYTATVSVDCPDEHVATFPLVSIEGKDLLKNANLFGIVNGGSVGHILARSVKDLPDKLNGNLRQDYDQNVDSPNDGGRVWEHWCTVQDISSRNAIGNSVLKAYLNMVALLGGRFVAVVARGRSDYDQPAQLVAILKADFMPTDDALVDITPTMIPMEA